MGDRHVKAGDMHVAFGRRISSRGVESSTFIRRVDKVECVYFSNTQTISHVEGNGSIDEWGEQGLDEIRAQTIYGSDCLHTCLGPTERSK